MKRFPITCALILLTLWLGMQPALAQETFSFQGRFTTPEGTPVADDTYAVRFQLFDQATDGSPLWEESHTVTTDDGVFSILLGTETALDLDAFELMPHLALTVDGTALGPRTPLTAVPYAMKSYRLDEAALVAGSNVTITQRADGALQIGSTGGGGTGGLTSVATDATMEGNGTSANPLGLADGSVTGEKLSNNALLAGANVDIVRRGNGSLEISSTGGGGGGGLAQVASDGTLAGDGTTGSPLQVSVPLVLANPGSGIVVEAQNGNGHQGYLGTTESGVYGRHANGNVGVLGRSDDGVFGKHANGNEGVLGGSSAAVSGRYSGGPYGSLGNSNYGVYGVNGNNVGWVGGPNQGVYGRHDNGTIGTLGGSDAGVYGSYGNGYYGSIGNSDYGVYGSNGSNEGYLGGSDFAAYGRHSGGNWGALGTSAFGGAFNGDVIVLGNLAKSSGSFKIDHPLDPANKYLSHSFVESPDMMNVYNGNVTTDENGEAVVTLPDYFEALNRDFRYQLTTIGGFAPVYIAEEIASNQFRIAGGEPGMKVSWQVTGIRQDAWAEENRIVVEEDKPTEERGYYVHPTLFGQPQERSILQAEAPQDIRTIQQMPTASEEKRPPRQP